MSDYLFTIITVCYNSEKTIEQTILSVLGQTNNDFEYIIIDGQSTDGTINIIKKYVEMYPKRMSFVSEKDEGIYDAMNKGISLAKGKLIGILNSDDWYERDALENINKAITDDDYAIYYGLQRIIQNGREKAVVLYNHEFIKEQMITHPTCFITKALYDKYGCYDVKYKSSADYDFMLRMIKKDDVIFWPIYRIITNFTLGGMSSSEQGYRETLGILYGNNELTTWQYLYRKSKSYLCELIKKYGKKRFFN